MAQGGIRMWVVRRGIPVAVSLAIVCALTATLWYVKLATARPHNPAFFYLLPITLVAIRYGSAPALLGVFTAFACADFFLYDPLYTFNICSRVELGDLIFFVVLAVAAVKSISQLFPPPHRPAPTTNPAPLDGHRFHGKAGRKHNNATK
jgi:K+-sensing histidine kinase KdpD